MLDLVVSLTTVNTSDKPEDLTTLGSEKIKLPQDSVDADGGHNDLAGLSE